MADQALRADDQGSIPASSSTGGRTPLSFGQRRLWFLDQLDPGSATYNVPEVLELTGRISATALSEAIGALMTRHDALRTVFRSADGVPWQEVLPDMDVVLRVRDVADPADLQPAITAEIATPFDIGAEPPIRALLLRRAAGTATLVITAHHIAVDGWSMDLLLDELADLHGGPGGAAPKPTVQYPDFALWQQNRDFSAQLDRMVRRLAGAPHRLDLPLDRPRPATQTYTGGQVWVDLPDDVMDAVRATGQRERMTSSMILLSALLVLLGRHSGQDDFLVGSLTSGRRHPDTESMIGFFVNQVVIRADLTGDPTVRELLARVRDAALDAYDAQDLPFERLVEHLQPDRNLSRSPLCQVLFNHLLRQRYEWHTGGSHWRRAHADEVSAKLDLSLYVWEGAGVQCQFVYNADLFGEQRVRDVAEQYLLLVRALTGAPDRRLSQVSLLTSRARAATPDPRASLPTRTVPGLVDHLLTRARRSPRTTVMVDPFRTWTYQDLTDGVARTSERLSDHGVAEGQVVAVLGARVGWLPVTVLAAIRLGAVVALLDPTCPRAWLDRQLAELRPGAVVDCTATDGRIVINDGSADRRVEPDMTTGGIILFTSGTTAAPKAVLSSSLPLSHFLDWHTTQFRLDETDRFAALSGLGHDPILRDCFTAPWVGGRVLWPPEDVRAEPRMLLEWLRDNKITAAHLTPTLAGMVATVDGPPVTSLRYLFLGGETLTNAHLDTLTRIAPLAVAVNFYGATETPQIAGYFVTTPRATSVGVPIGRGIEGTQLLVVNGNIGLAGVGELGELVVRSPYLGSRYLDSATGEPYSANPFVDAPTDRVYWTGDLARLRPDGTVELAGRRDRQLSLAGHRIEPAQVEAVLTEHPDVWEAAVVRRGERIAAHVVAVPGAAPTVGELTTYLAEHLPEHLRPAHIALTDFLPMTSNGKIDEDALHAVDFPDAGEAVEEIDDPVMAVLAEVWADVLGAPPAGLNQSFFEVGHSLLATRYVVGVRRRLGVDLTLRVLFAHPSIAGLAGYLRGDR